MTGPARTPPESEAAVRPAAGAEPLVLPPGTELEVEAGAAVAGGRCLARHEGKVLLVVGALPGERVRVRVTRDEARWAEADAVAVLEAHPQRREPPCPHAAECGGCDWQHAERDLQLAMKRDIVIDAFSRLGGLDVAGMLEGPAAVGDEFRTRNRVRLSWHPDGRPGLLRRGSHDVVPIDGCGLVSEVFDREILPWLRMNPPWKRAGVRVDDDGRAIVHFETGDPPNEKDRRRFGKIVKAMERPERIVGLLADRIPLAGARHLHFRVGESRFRADAGSFFQTSRPGAEELVRVVADFLGGDRRGQLLDLYAGVGLFAVSVGRGFDRVIASDADARAVRHLKHNLRRHAVRAQARAEPAVVTLTGAPPADPETVLTDPPRVGLAKEVRRALVRRAPARIVSVSCDPATAARDAGALVRAGFELERLAAVDLFPVTAHVETVALLVRGDAAPA